MEQEQQLTESVGYEDYDYLTDFTVDGYMQDVFAACIAIGAILPVAGLIIASIIRAVRVAIGHDTD